MADGINLGKAYVQIIPSAEGISGKLSSVIDGEADSAGKSGGAKLSSALGGALKTGLGLAVGAATTGAAAVGAFAKNAVSSFGQYEQLVGGIDKLYGDASGQLQDFAKEAYKTSGLSANAYMETATSFSASLISSLDGDVQKAAELTDVAMRAMSDNANVFGSDIGSIQNAYQGFAKQNYTMLDNLKLGYGGTKSEMERLIADANEYRASIGETSDLSIDSYADIVQAIQSVQEAQGIAGTTNKEAMSTLEGSGAAVTAAWENVVTAIGSGDGIKESIDALVGSIFGDGEGGGLLSNILPAVQRSIEGIGEFISTAAPIITQQLPPLIEQIVPPVLEAGITLIGALGEGLISALPTLIPIAFDAIMEIVNALLENLPALLEAAIQIIAMLAQGIADSLPELIPTIVNCVLMIVETLIDNVDLLIDASIALILGLAEGLINALPVLIEKAPEIVEKLINAIIENAPKIVMAAIELVFSLIKGIGENLPKIVEAGWKIITSIIKGIGEWLSKLPETGAKIIGKIKEGIAKLNPLQWGKDLIDNFIKGITGGIQAVKDAVGKVAGAVKDFLGFSEPEDGPLSNFHTFAPDMMKLFAQGIDQNVGVVTDSVEDMSAQVAGAMKNDLDGAAFDVAANVSTNGRGGMDSVNMGGVTIQVYGAPGQDERIIAQRVSEILNRQVINARAVFA